MKKLVQGEKAEFTFQLATKSKAGLVKPFDLSTNTEITVRFRAGSTTLAKNRVANPVGVVVLGFDADGKIQATLAVADTDAMPKTTSGLVEVVVTKPGGDVRKFQLKNAFQVDEKLG